MQHGRRGKGNRHRTPRLPPLRARTRRIVHSPVGRAGEVETSLRPPRQQRKYHRAATSCVLLAPLVPSGRGLGRRPPQCVPGGPLRDSAGGSALAPRVLNVEDYAEQAEADHGAAEEKHHPRANVRSGLLGSSEAHDQTGRHQKKADKRLGVCRRAFNAGVSTSARCPEAATSGYLQCLDSSSLARPGPQLDKQTEVIADGPMLGDLAAFDSKQVQERPRDVLPGDRNAGQERHGRGDVVPVQSEVDRYSVVISDDLMLLEGEVAQVVPQVVERRAKTLAALGCGCVIDESGRDEVVEGSKVARRDPLTELHDDPSALLSLIAHDRRILAVSR